MKAAVVVTPGAPCFGEFEAPIETAEHAVVMVRAAAISALDRLLVTGKHYLSPKTWPAVAGRDGVGTLADGRRVYFDGPVPPYGSMAERTLVAQSAMVDVPAGTDDAIAAALGNAGLAAWLPLSWRAPIQPGQTVAILGAGGTVGRLAVQAAQLLGAGRVVAIDRGREKLAEVKALGADDTIDTAETSDLVAACRTAAPSGFDIILDYLWGQPALAAMQAAAMSARIVHVGTTAADELTLPGALLRSRQLQVSGFVGAFVPQPVRIEAYQRLCRLTIDGKLIFPVRRFALSEVEQAWSFREGAIRAVLTP
jgi:NADPH:quinone reductase-like Zn-dependent oxidoreductase